MNSFFNHATTTWAKTLLWLLDLNPYIVRFCDYRFSFTFYFIGVLRNVPYFICATQTTRHLIVPALRSILSMRNSPSTSSYQNFQFGKRLLSWWVHKDFVAKSARTDLACIFTLHSCNIKFTLYHCWIFVSDRLNFTLTLEGECKRFRLLITFYSAKKFLCTNK